MDIFSEDDQTKKTIGKIADSINRKRRHEIFQIYENSDVFKEIKAIKDRGTYEKGNRTKTMRKLASLPLEVDLFFTKVYGKDYYKEKNFFREIAPEWRVIR